MVNFAVVSNVRALKSSIDEKLNKLKYTFFWIQKPFHAKNLEKFQQTLTSIGFDQTSINFKRNQGSSNLLEQVFSMVY